MILNAPRGPFANTESREVKFRSRVSSAASVISTASGGSGQRQRQGGGEVTMMPGEATAFQSAQASFGRAPSERLPAESVGDYEVPCVPRSGPFPTAAASPRVPRSSTPRRFDYSEARPQRSPAASSAGDCGAHPVAQYPRGVTPPRGMTPTQHSPSSSVDGSNAGGMTATDHSQVAQYHRGVTPPRGMTPTRHSPSSSVDGSIAGGMTATNHSQVAQYSRGVTPPRGMTPTRHSPSSSLDGSNAGGMTATDHSQAPYSRGMIPRSCAESSDGAVYVSDKLASDKGAGSCMSRSLSSASIFAEYHGQRVQPRRSGVKLIADNPIFRSVVGEVVFGSPRSAGRGRVDAHDHDAKVNDTRFCLRPRFNIVPEGYDSYAGGRSHTPRSSSRRVYPKHKSDSVGSVVFHHSAEENRPVFSEYCHSAGRPIHVRRPDDTVVHPQAKRIYPRMPSPNCVEVCLQHEDAFPRSVTPRPQLAKGGNAEAQYFMSQFAQAAGVSPRFHRDAGGTVRLVGSEGTPYDIGR